MTMKKTVVVYVLRDLIKINNARAALMFCNVLVAEHAEHIVVVLGSSSQDN